jgi:hypothetical protein
MRMEKWSGSAEISARIGQMIARRVSRAMVVAVLVWVGTVSSAFAAGYTSRPASHGEEAAMIASATATRVCGWHGQTKQLGRFRVVAYRTNGVLIKWGATVWSPPGGQECVLVFLHASSVRYFSSKPPGLRRARVAWLPFTWGSSPFENGAYLDSEWKNVPVAASHPRWAALNRALVFPLF